MNRKLTTEQKLWLYSKGGRNAKDVKVDSKGELYVEMISYLGDEKVYVEEVTRKYWMIKYPNINFSKFIKTI